MSEQIGPLTKLWSQDDEGNINRLSDNSFTYINTINPLSLIVSTLLQRLLAFNVLSLNIPLTTFLALYYV